MKTSGLYACCLKASFFSLVWLIWQKVASAQLSAPAEVTADRGGSVTISCEYSPNYLDHTKYWCKGRIYELCRIVVKTTTPKQRRRSSIKEDKDARVFTVTMTSLRQSDEGKYWCVISTPGRNVIAGVNLLIHTGITPTSTSTISSKTQGQNDTCDTYRCVEDKCCAENYVNSHKVTAKMDYFSCNVWQHICTKS